MLGLRDLGFQGFGFLGSGFGFRGSGFEGLGFGVLLGLGVEGSGPLNPKPKALNRTRDPTREPTGTGRTPRVYLEGQRT